MKNKRFIAGAHCPACKEQDKIFTYENGAEKYRACARCDFEEALNFDLPPAELETRVNQTKAQRVESVQAVRLMDPKNSDL